MKFDRLAPHYDWMESSLAGKRLQCARTAWLEQLNGRRRILSVGEGHGRFAGACVARFPEAELTCVEMSPGMLARARRRLGPAAARVHWQHRDVRTWKPDRPFDAIVTCFFLDCFPPDALANVVGHLARCAAPDALWFVVDFALPPHGPARWRARAVHFLMYEFFRRTVALPARRLTPPDDLLQSHGFDLIARREFDWGLLRAEVWRRANG